MCAVAGLPSREMRWRAQQMGLTDLTGLNTAVVVARINELAWVSVYSDGLSDDQLRVLGHARATTVQEGLHRALRRQGPGARVVIITQRGDMCPVLGVPA